MVQYTHTMNQRHAPETLPFPENSSTATPSTPLSSLAPSLSLQSLRQTAISATVIIDYYVIPSALTSQESHWQVSRVLWWSHEGGKVV